MGGRHGSLLDGSVLGRRAPVLETLLDPWRALNVHGAGRHMGVPYGFRWS